MFRPICADAPGSARAAGRRTSAPSTLTTVSTRRKPVMQLHRGCTEAAHQHTQAARAVSGTAEIAQQDTDTRDAGPAPSKSARETLNGVGVEQYPEIEATIEGKLPAWLSGTLITNGGGDYSRMNHQYDGFAFVSKVKVSGGKAWGSQRFLQTKAYQEYKQTGLVRYREFYKQPEGSGIIDSLKQTLSSLAGAITDNASVAFAPMGTPPPGTKRVVLAMTETPNGHYLIDPDEISIVQKAHYQDGVPGLLTTVHGHRLSDGQWVNFTRTFPNGGVFVIKQNPKTLQRTQVAYIPDRRPNTPAWVHDFAATDNYVVIIEPPLYMSLGSMLFGKLGGRVSHLFMDWKPEDEVKVYLVPLNGGAMKTFTCPPFFFMHAGNCFESADGQTLYVDLAVYKDPDILCDLTLDKLRSSTVAGDGMSPSHYQRVAIPLAEGANSRLQAPQPILHPQQQQSGKTQDPMGDYCEFPVINFKYWGKPYRYAYSHAAVRPTTQGNGISKIDVERGTAKVWENLGGAVGEPAFVARPGAKHEDDGVVVVPAVGSDGKSFMAVIDAAKWQEVARVHLPYGTPHRFHGMWVPDGK